MSRTRVLVRTACARGPPASAHRHRSSDRCWIEDGPIGLGTLLGRLGDMAIIDTRVLLAHRLGADERLAGAGDRFASDLLLHEQIADPWLRDLTAAAAAASIPVLLGGHSLVGPGLRLAIGRRAGGGLG